MTSKGILTRCIEELEIFKQVPLIDRFEYIKFEKDVFYTALPTDNGVHVIDRNHRNIILNNEIFTKFFNVK